MNLVLDLGNTARKLALFKDYELIKLHSFSRISEATISRFCKGYPVRSAILSSVVNLPESFLKFLNGDFSVLVLDENTALPIKNLYETPDTLGKDRLANAVAAVNLFPGDPVLCIDAGTCIKYDFITGKAEYLGGAISPGLQMRLKAMHTFTARLPLIEVSEPAGLIGKNTKQSLLSGAINGTVAEINGIIQGYREQYKGLKVVLTGGDLVFFENILKSRIFAVPHLVLEGLNLILNYNVVKK